MNREKEIEEQNKIIPTSKKHGRKRNTYFYYNIQLFIHIQNRWRPTNISDPKPTKLEKKIYIYKKRSNREIVIKKKKN